MTHDTIDALGYVEVRGLAAAIETADAMLKSAEVRLLRQLLRDPAQITITVEGSLGACHAAIDAGQASATRMGAYIASRVMGRPARDTEDFVLSLAEAGRRPFGETPTDAARHRTPNGTPNGALNESLIAALAGSTGGQSAQHLAQKLGADRETVRRHLETLCAAGRLLKRRGRYLLASDGGEK